MKAFSLSSVFAAALLLLSANAHAGVYSNDLSRCLVESSTSEDKLTLVKWMFTAMSLHPAVKSIASVSPEQVDKANHDVANLFVKLITRTCKNETMKAMKYEGDVALKTSFNLFGQVAAKELFSNPQVAAGMAGLVKYLDAKEIKDTLGVNR